MLLSDVAKWARRSLFSIKNNLVSVRTQQYRLDAAGKLYDIESDPGQRIDVAARQATLASEPGKLAEQHNAEMQTYFKANANRPFTVGYGPSTTLTARDGIGHGNIRRSVKSPNNSFFTNWTDDDDFITWDVDIGKSGEYEVIVFYTCARGNEGATLQLSITNGASTKAIVNEVFDPPLYDKSKERVAKSHYFVKDFKPLTLGTLHLDKGKGTLRLKASDMKGQQVIDVHSLDLLLR